MNFSEKVKKVNEILTNEGSSAVQTYDTGSFMAIGYKPQFIIDAVNEVFGAGMWRHKLHSHDIKEVPSKKGTRQVCVVELSVEFFNENSELVYATGSHFGGGNVISGNVADGLKSAVTDALGKTLSVLSIGNLAYRGTLAKEYKDKAVEVPAPDATNFVSAKNVSPARFKPLGGNGQDKEQPVKAAFTTPAPKQEEAPVEAAPVPATAFTTPAPKLEEATAKEEPGKPVSRFAAMRAKETAEETAPTPTEVTKTAPKATFKTSGFNKSFGK